MSNKKADLIKDARKESRYPCVGIPVLYSPANSTCTGNLADCLYKAVAVDMSLSGLAFDVYQKMYAGDALRILLEKTGGNVFEELSSEVRWCEELSPKQYRVGVVIDASAKIINTQLSAQRNEFVGELEVPKEINSCCPSCKQQATFDFVSYQPVLAGNGVMPLYNCSLCGTTRSLTGVLGHTN